MLTRIQEHIRCSSQHNITHHACAMISRWIYALMLRRNIDNKEYMDTMVHNYKVIDNKDSYLLVMRTNKQH